ncbi:hypothetical protein [Alkalithermobacter paradoxus]|uniref:Uncharacterized protein n=1 Tax=Alkalithermobacter paradoxus TaxID=29349 RepID=A0A1V4I956_9FIRM|nr:hypothetical protein CLOTH_08180 [[Clostridium] thermoalcaliphilum]
MKIYYNEIFLVLLLIILISIQYSINKIIVILKEIRNILCEVKIKDKM